MVEDSSLGYARMNPPSYLKSWIFEQHLTVTGLTLGCYYKRGPRCLSRQVAAKDLIVSSYLILMLGLFLLLYYGPALMRWRDYESGFQT